MQNPASQNQPAPQAESSGPLNTISKRTHIPERLLWQNQMRPAFWTTASILSMIVNVILIIALIIVTTQLFAIKSLLDGLIGGLHGNFVAMDQAHIQTTINVKDTIQVNDTIPVVFTLPLQQETAVIVTQNTPVQGATVFLNGSPVRTDIILPKGMQLNIALNLNVPVNQTIPISLKVPIDLQVPVDIALDQTELHPPFVGLRTVVQPYKDMLDGLPNSWSEFFLGYK